MTNEIKEILDKAKEISDYGADGKQHTRMFNQFEAKALLDYITNLQEKIKNLDLDLDSYKSKYNNIKLHYEELAKENKDLQQQKDKAIEYIDDLKQLKKIDYLKSVEMKYIDKLLDILKGDE